MLEKAAGVALKDDGLAVARAVVSDPAARFDLRWDRYVRLSACAQALAGLAAAPNRAVSILDVGGFDGALALFLPQYEVDVLDPATTGGEITLLPPLSYDIVVAVDVLEHVEPRQRAVFLAHLARVARHACLVNYPLPASSTAQRVVAAITGDSLVADHVRLGLPYAATVESQFEGIGFVCSTAQYASRSLWATFMALHSVDQELGSNITRYLIEEHQQDSYPDPLYELVTAIRRA